MSHLKLVALLFALLVAVTALWPHAWIAKATSGDIQPGLDFFETAENTKIIFDRDSQIPAGFFDPGSDPFQGNICLRGGRIHPPKLGTTDTIVKRLQGINFGQDHVDMIPIEIVALDLVSCEPITVTHNGGANPEQWDVKVGLSTMPQPLGQMTVMKENANGGTFSAELPVLPRFTFTRLEMPKTRMLDFGIHKLPALQFRATDAPWRFQCPPEAGVLKVPHLNKGFCPLVDDRARVPAAFRALSIVGTLQAQHVVLPAVKPPLDHFKCYEARAIGRFPRTTVLLQDQFDAATPLAELERVNLLGAFRFCNPVQKTHTGAVTPIQNGANHLKLYNIAPINEPAITRSVLVSNQFGAQQTLITRRPVVLAVPTLKFDISPKTLSGLAPSGLDHFKCYEAQGQPINQLVDLQDQFHVERDVRVLQPLLFCNPTTKVHAGKVTPIQNPTAHLTCYAIPPARFSTFVVTLNQFGNESLKIGSPELLCVPSLKIAWQVIVGGDN